MKKSKEPLNIDPRKLTKSNVCFLIGINDQTLEDWYQIKGCPFVKDRGEILFNLHDVFKWRLGYEKGKSKQKDDEAEEGISFNEAKRLETYESYRKKKIENDLAEKKTYNADEVDNKFYELASGVKVAMLNIVPRISHSLVKKDRFQIERMLTKEITDSLNQYGESVK